MIIILTLTYPRATTINGVNNARERATKKFKGQLSFRVIDSTLIKIWIADLTCCVCTFLPINAGPLPTAIQINYPIDYTLQRYQ